MNQKAPLGKLLLALVMIVGAWGRDATAHFQRALALAPDNPAIRDSAILKAHLGM